MSKPLAVPKFDQLDVTTLGQSYFQGNTMFINMSVYDYMRYYLSLFRCFDDEIWIRNKDLPIYWESYKLRDYYQRLK